MARRAQGGLAHRIELHVHTPTLRYLQDSLGNVSGANAVFAAILEGSLTVDIEGHYALEEVQQVHARIEARQQIGKAVVWLDRELH